MTGKRYVARLGNAKETKRKGCSSVVTMVTMVTMGMADGVTVVGGDKL